VLPPCLTTDIKNYKYSHSCYTPLWNLGTQGYHSLLGAVEHLRTKTSVLLSGTPLPEADKKQKKKDFGPKFEGKSP
jgi:hypothetical protein